MANIIGTNLADNLQGTNETDVINGLAGNDTITSYDFNLSSPQNDSLYGGDGNDTITAFGGNDVIKGEAGNDRIYVGPSNPAIKTPSGNYSVDGGAGDDQVSVTGGIYGLEYHGGSGSNYLLVENNHGRVNAFGDTGQNAFVFKNVGAAGGNEEYTVYMSNTPGAGARGDAATIMLKAMDGAAATAKVSVYGTDNAELAEFFQGAFPTNSLDHSVDAVLSLGGGNDIYNVSAAHVRIVESASGGNDEIRVSWKDVKLDDGILSNDHIDLSDFVETIYLAQSITVDMTGGVMAHRFDAQNSPAANQTIIGGSGNDTFIGGGGNDVLDGGKIIPGSSSVDTFLFHSGTGKDLVAVDGMIGDFRIGIKTGANGTINSLSDIHITQAPYGVYVIDLGQNNTISLVGAASLEQVQESLYLF